jgi:hypothetical protein
LKDGSASCSGSMPAGAERLCLRFFCLSRQVPVLRVGLGAAKSFVSRRCSNFCYLPPPHVDHVAGFALAFWCKNVRTKRTKSLRRVGAPHSQREIVGRETREDKTNCGHIQLDSFCARLALDKWRARKNTGGDPQAAHFCPDGFALQKRRSAGPLRGIHGPVLVIAEAVVRS